MKIILLILLCLSSAFAKETESETFLKRCFLKEYPGDKSVKQVVLAIYEDLAGDSYSDLEVKLKNTNGPTAGIVSSSCQLNEKTFVCKLPEDEGKLTFVDEGQSGTLTIDEPVKLKMKNEYFPGKSSVTRLPASTAVKMSEIHSGGCEKLVP